MKKIVYIASSAGVDGRGTQKAMLANWDEDELVKTHNAHPNKNWMHVHERIVNTEEVRKKALAKLDAVDRLVLGID